MKKFLVSILLLASPAAFAQVGGYLNGGLSIATYENEDSEDFGIELDTGTGFNLTGGIRFSPGFDVRLSYVQTTHDGGDLTFEDDFDGSFDDEVKLSEFRAGFFYAMTPKPVGFRVGGGYTEQGFEFEDEDEFTTDGLFLEAALVVNAGKFVTFDIGGTFLALEDEEDGETGGFEFNVKSLFHVGPVDLGVGYRLLGMHTEYDEDDYELDEVYGEFRLTIGGSWGFPKAKPGN
jgi:hypothetical protein